MSDLNLTPPVAPDLDLPPERPTWPLVIGWISLVWAVFGLGCMSCGVVSLVFAPQMIKADPNFSGELPPSMNLGPAMIANFAVAAITGIVLVIAGGLTIGRKAAGRTAHLAYAGLAVISTGVGVVAQLGVMREMTAWRAANPSSPFSQSGNIGEIIGLVAAVVLGLGYPAFIAIWFLASKRGKGPMDAVGPEIV
jgi:hypothetical protein